jgi:hypothetical protein
MEMFLWFKSVRNSFVALGPVEEARENIGPNEVPPEPL